MKTNEKIKELMLDGNPFCFDLDIIELKNRFFSLRQLTDKRGDVCVIYDNEHFSNIYFNENYFEIYTSFLEVSVKLKCKYSQIKIYELK